MEILNLIGDLIGVISDVLNGGIDLLDNALEFETLSSGSSFGSSSPAEPAPVEPVTS